MQDWNDPIAECRGRKTGLRCFCALLVCAACASRAAALDLGSDGLARDETFAFGEGLKRWDNIKKYGAERIIDRDRTMYQPDGVRAGNYLVFPSVGTRVIFDDNVFATRTNKQSDVLFEVRPELRFQSHLPRHVLDFALGGRFTSYAEHSDLDTADGYASMNGALHIDSAHTLSVGLLSRYEHQDPFAPEAPVGAREKTPVWHNRATLGLRRDAGRLYGMISATADSWNFFDVKARDGSTIDQDNRDTEVLSTQLTTGYRFSPGYEVQAKVRGLRQNSAGLGGLDRDAWGYEALAGVVGEFNPLVRWRVLGGYGIRDFDQASLGTSAATLAEAEIQWLPTQLMTVTGTARRAFADGSASDFSSGRIDTALLARLDYEAWRNLVFTLGAEYRDSDFIGEGRHDRLYAGRIGFDYYHTKNWLFSAGYEYQHQDSNVAEKDLTRNKVWVGAKLRF